MMLGRASPWGAKLQKLTGLSLKEKQTLLLGSTNQKLGFYPYKLNTVWVVQVCERGRRGLRGFHNMVICDAKQYVNVKEPVPKVNNESSTQVYTSKSVTLFYCYGNKRANTLTRQVRGRHLKGNVNFRLGFITYVFPFFRYVALRHCVINARRFERAACSHRERSKCHMNSGKGGCMTTDSQ